MRFQSANNYFQFNKATPQIQTQRSLQVTSSLDNNLSAKHRLQIILVKTNVNNTLTVWLTIIYGLQMMELENKIIKNITEIGQKIPRKR